jgi:hypothetical protein
MYFDSGAWYRGEVNFDKFYDDYERETWCISQVTYDGFITGEVLVSDLTGPQADDVLALLKRIVDEATEAMY